MPNPKYQVIFIIIINYICFCSISTSKSVFSEKTGVYAKKPRKNFYGGRFIPVLASKSGQNRILRFFSAVREECKRTTGCFGLFTAGWSL